MAMHSKHTAPSTGLQVYITTLRCTSFLLSFIVSHSSRIHSGDGCHLNCHLNYHHFYSQLSWITYAYIQDNNTSGHYLQIYPLSCAGVFLFFLVLSEASLVKCTLTPSPADNVFTRQGHRNKNLSRVLALQCSTKKIKIVRVRSAIDG